MSDEPKTPAEAWDDLGKAIMASHVGRFFYWLLERMLDAQHWLEKRLRNER